jgi:hypothetical protein
MVQRIICIDISVSSLFPNDRLANRITSTLIKMPLIKMAQKKSNMRSNVYSIACLFVFQNDA